MRAAGRISMVAAAVVLVAAGTITMTLAPAAAQQVGPTVTIEPAMDLVDGTPVSVSVSGLRPHAFSEAVQCAAGGADVLDRCDFLDSAFGDADASGTATLTLKIDALLTPGFAGDEVDCRTSECQLVILSEDFEPVATAALHFDSDAALAPPPTLTVTPDDQLADLQAVEVSGSGLVWSDHAVVVQCIPAPADIDDCDFDTLTDVAVDAGSFTADYPVSAVMDTGNSGPIDCREAGACVLAVSSGYSTSPAKSAFVPLGFDPDTEVEVGTITVEPDTDLVDGQTVSVTGSGFPPDRGVSFYVCATGPSGESCEFTPNFAFVDESGAFTVTDVRVWATVRTETGEIDCRAVAEGCTLVASAGSPSSPRAGRAALHFDPDAPLLPGPAITVEPSSGLPDDTTATVSGEHFTPDGFVSVAVCASGDISRCDPQSEASPTPDAAGAFSLEISVGVAFNSWEDERVDCRAAPGCSVVAYDYERGRQAEAPLTFAAPVPATRRYLEPVFDDVEVTHDVVYRDTVDAHGNPVQLTLDVYEPAGDTATRRPAVVWMHGGWFSEGDKADMAAYAEAFARRGYVAVSMEYRMRPDLRCCPTRDAIGVTEALVDGRDDAMAGLEWLHEHAAEYRIDSRAIAVGGDGAGAANAFGLAFSDEAPGHPGGGHGMAAQAAMNDGEAPTLAAALPISGVSLGRPAEGAPPLLAFHGTEDSLAPLHLAEANCARAQALGSHCETVAYEGAWNDIAFTRERDIIRRSSDFLAETVLGPLGYLEEAPEPPATTTTTRAASGGTTTTLKSPVAPVGGSSLPRTGSEAWPLAWAGLGLTGLGALVLVARRLAVWRRRAVGAGVLIVVVGVGLVVPRAAAADDPPASTVPSSTTSTTSPPTLPASTTSSTSLPTVSTSLVPPSTTSSTSPPTVPPPTTTAAPSEPAPDAPAPPHEFPDDWTPEQVAFATRLIADTEEALERYRNPAILGLLGYVWITDGTRLDGYQHWINTGWIGDQHTLNPEFPESLVFRNAADGPVLEAAMYMLGVGHTMDSIPEDIAWLPGWHVHTNLCFEGLRLVGIAVNGVCERGAILIPPPMVHVWIVDTRCGRFPGVDEHGLMCHDEHEGEPAHPDEHG